MSAIFGHLNIQDSDYVFNATQGQRVIYDAAQAYLDRINADIEKALGVFVDESTSEYKRRYKLPGGGSLQRRGSDGRYGAVKAYGQWDVAFPLEDFGAQLAGNDVDMAYMTAAELDRHIQTIAAQNVSTVRYEMLKRLFKNTQSTFIDPKWGSLSVEGLANGDSVVYPPVLGSESEATDTHYLESNYASSSISDTNNPFITIRDELEEHFGTNTGGSSIVVFVNNAQRAKIEALSDFDAVPFSFIRPGADTDLPMNLPAGLPGSLLGTCSGTIIVEWRWIPADYMFGIHLDAPKPLIRRVDDPATGLGTGLQLVATDEEYPFRGSFWRNRFGFGAGNRLNGVALEFGTGGSYTIPTAYQ